MKEIPIILETTGSEIFEEYVTQSNIGDGEPSKGRQDDLSILMEDASMPIAVIGMGFRGPADATDTNTLWQMILEQREAWSPIPKDRWNNKAFYHPDHARHGTINVEGGNFIAEDLSLFDAPFFNMTSDEAASMDPQQRLLLEVTYEGLENAGIPLTRVTGTRTSCFVGSFCADYTDLLLRDPECVPMYQCTNAGQSRAMMANRVPYFFDLKGPSVTVDTACSGSLVALHLACQSLRTGDASMAIAAGVNLILSHEFMSTMSMMRFLSPDGRCHTFDEKASGYARGEAIACLILKPLTSALRDGDTIRAVIRGTGSNHDGRTPGITLPSQTAQEALIRDVYARAGLCPTETEVVEAHGTGTQAGDPVEIGAIATSFELGHDPDRILRIGSIKTNIGHVEGASGVAGVIKSILMLENRVILPSRNFETPNPRIAFGEWNLKVPQVPEPWNTPGPHRVSVNSFGYGGSNAHVIVEDAEGYLSERGLQRWFRAPSQITRKRHLVHDYVECPDSPQQRVFMISAFDEPSCKSEIATLRDYLESNKDLIRDDFLDDLAFTLNEKRTSFMWKTAVIGSSVTDLCHSLSDSLKIRCSARRPTLAFVFTGQGAQWVGMGKELLHTYPAFSESISRIDKYLAELGAPIYVIEELSRSPEDSQLNHPLPSQAICSALQIALVDLLASWNIYPDSVTGHSSGEIAAAYACGALTMADAMAVAYFRGIAASQLLISPGIKGAMIAVGMSDEATRVYLRKLSSGKAGVACINSPSSVTISGDETAIDELAEMLKDKAVFFRRLAVDVAYHSHHMEIVADEYLSSIEHVSPCHDHALASRLGKIAVFSSVTGSEIRPSEMGPQYWVSNLLGQVKFSEALRNLCFMTDSHQNVANRISRRREKQKGAAQKPCVDCLLEIGPHSALAGPIKQIIQEDTKLRTADITYLSMLSRKTDAVSSALAAVSVLATMSYPVNFGAVNVPKGDGVALKPRLVVDMPSYRWNHTRPYWAEPRLSKTYRNREYPRTDLLGAPENMACPFERRWRNYIRTSEIPWLQDHRIQSDMIFPAAGYIAMAIEAVIQLIDDTNHVEEFILQDVHIRSALIVPEESGVEVMTSLRDSDKGLKDEPDQWYEFHIYSVTHENQWTEHCAGFIGTQIDSSLDDDETFVDLNGFATAPTTTNTRNISVVDIPQLYQKLHQVGLEYGPCFSNLTCVHTTQHGVCFAEVIIPDTRAVMPMNFENPAIIHPCTLDSIFHTIFAALPENMELETGSLIPVSFETVKVSRQIQRSAGQMLSICTHAQPGVKNTLVASIIATDNFDGLSSMKPKLAIHGLRCARLQESENHIDKNKDIPIAYGIEWQADPGFITKDNAAFLIQRQDRDPSQSLPLQASCERYTAGIIKDAIAKLSEEGIGTLDLKYGRYRADLMAILHTHDKNHQIYPSDDFELLRNEEKCVSSGVKELLRVISSHISSLPPRNLESFKETQKKIWNAYQELITEDLAYTTAAKYVGLVGNKKPDISVLEISDGGDRPHTLFLEELAPRHGDDKDIVPHCAKYTFALRDKNQSDQARAHLSRWEDMVSLENLDHDPDLSEQELSQNFYDVIIAPNFFYSTQYLKRELLKIRSLLKPSGYLILPDTLQPKRSPFDALLVTTFYHWPHESTQSFIQSRDMKGETLLEAGFKAEDILEDGLIVCRSQHEPKPYDKKTLVVCEDNDETSLKFSEALIQRLPGEMAVSNMMEANTHGCICIVISDLNKSSFQSPNANELQKLKDIFLQSDGVLWVTRGGTIHATDPKGGLAVGFARTARSESGGQPIIILDLDPHTPILDDSKVNIILDIMKTHFFREGPPESDTEYAERDGVVLLPRVVVQGDLNRNIKMMNKAQEFSQEQFQHPDNVLSLRRTEVGQDKVCFTASRQSTEIHEGHIGIKVFAFALSEFDTESGKESSDIFDTIGFGCSGKVCQVGLDVHEFSVGDRVACLGTGTARNYYYNQASAFQRIKDDTPFDLAASLPLAYTAAYWTVYEVARIRPGDTVVIQDAANWYGLALTEICMLNECEVFAIVSTDAQKELISETFQISLWQVFVDGKDNIARRLLEYTHGRLPGTVLTFAVPGSKIFKTLCKITAPFGHVIHLRTKAPDRSTGHTLQLDLKNVSFSTFDIFDFQTNKNVITFKNWPKVISLFNQGKLRGSSSYSVHKVTDVANAIRAISSTNYAMIVTESDDFVQVTTANIPKSLFRNDASYLVVGGLGGIGREIISWMVEHGAKYLILVNRSGLATDTARSTVRLLRDKDVEVAVRGCDVSDEQAFCEMHNEISKTMPPIRGAIQAAMILQDVHIEKMTVEAYNTVLRPKYAGTLNLHNYLPRDLDFFVMLSSISGVIGNATQSAYAAGSAFMDSFAAYRNTLGLPAVSLDLGTVMSAGYLAENKELAEKMAKQGFQSTDIKTVLSLVQLAILEPPTGSHSQIVTGLGEWKTGKSLSIFEAPLFSHFRRRFQLNDPHEEKLDYSETLRENLRAAKSRDEAMLFIFEALSAKIAAHLNIPIDKISPESLLSEFGIDSTNAVELRNWISKTMESVVPILEILASGSIVQLAGQITSRSQLLNCQ